jgi:hypothetical protein
VERLEERATPAVFGYPWPDAGHLTVSFAPDGTPLGQAWTDASGAAHQAPGSQMAGFLAGAAWQQEVLRALATWSAQANVNFAVVGDSGDPFGAAGLVQGDPRFGDVRVAGAALSSTSVATSVPFSPVAGTWAGDLLLNTSYPFSVGGAAGYDLFTVALHEAGHILGLPDGTDPNSPMFGYYTGPKQGLTAADVAAVQALYGARQPDAYEGPAGNDTLATAAPLHKGAAADVTADLTTASDIDVYSYRATGQPPGFTVRLASAALSLVHARLTVLDSAGQDVACGSGPGDVTLHVDAHAGNRYYLRVEAADAGVFGVGAYHLCVRPDDPHAQVSGGSLPQANTTLLTATVLQPRPGTSPVSFFAAGQIDPAGDLAYYRLNLPAGGSSLSVLLMGAGNLGVAVLDAGGQTLATQAGQGQAWLRLDGLSAGSDYYLAVSAAAGASYRVSAVVNTPVVAAPVVATGVLTDDTPQAFLGVYLPEGGVLHLDVGLASLGGPAAVELALFDLQGNMVYRDVATTGQTLSLNLLLPAGAYTLRLVGGSGDGSPLAGVTFTIASELLNDPIGPKLIDPTVLPPDDPPIQWFGGGFYVELALVDPYGRPVRLMPPPPVVGAP